MPNIGSCQRAGLWASVLFAICGCPAWASTQIVNTLADSGPGSLRQAMLNAGVGDTIMFNVTGTIALTGNLPVIIADLTITGPGAASLVIDGGNNFALFGIIAGNVTISGLTLKNGHAAAGGAAFNVATLTLNNDVLTGNTADQFGGAIANVGTLTVTNSTLSGNMASEFGGAFYNLTVAQLTNCTLSGNSAPAGGAILDASGTVTLTDDTFTGNDGDAIGTFGGAVVTVQDTLLAHGTTGTNCAGDGTVTSLGYNLSDDNSCTGLTLTGDLNNHPAGLDPAGLQNNGGPTPTIALLPTSAAVNAIPTGSCTFPTDQRGAVRPQGPGCDIGAFERVGFRSIAAKLSIVPGRVGGFTLNAVLTPGFAGDVFNPVLQPVALQVGTYSVTLPAGSFQLQGGHWVFVGTVNGVTLNIQILPLAGGKLQFEATATGANYVSLASPAAVAISIGGESGTATVPY